MPEVYLIQCEERFTGYEGDSNFIEGSLIFPNERIEIPLNQRNILIHLLRNEFPKLIENTRETGWDNDSLKRLKEVDFKTWTREMVNKGDLSSHAEYSCHKIRFPDGFSEILGQMRTSNIVIEGLDEELMRVLKNSENWTENY